MCLTDVDEYVLKGYIILAHDRRKMTTFAPNAQEHLTALTYHGAYALSIRLLLKPLGILYLFKFTNSEFRRPRWPIIFLLILAMKTRDFFWP